MNFGPKNQEEAVIFAIEELRADVQYDILRSLKEAGLSQAQLAKKMGVSAAWVSQLLSDEANLTVESIAKVYAALNKTVGFKSERGQTDKRAAVEQKSALTAASWMVEELQFSRTEIFEKRKNNTTHLLMHAIASSASRRIRPVETCNDNMAEVVKFVEVA